MTNEHITKLIKDVIEIEIETINNGEFIETKINYDEIARHLLNNMYLMPDVNVGDKVYTIDKHIVEYEVFKLIIEQNELEKRVTFFIKSIPTNYRPYVTYSSYDLSEIGSKVYLSYEDAKKAL